MCIQEYCYQVCANIWWNRSKIFEMIQLQTDRHPPPIFIIISLCYKNVCTLRHVLVMYWELLRWAKSIAWDQILSQRHLTLLDPMPENYRRTVILLTWRYIYVFTHWYCKPLSPHEVNKSKEYFIIWEIL